jgi:hypothetical protein
MEIRSSAATIQLECNLVKFSYNAYKANSGNDLATSFSGFNRHFRRGSPEKRLELQSFVLLLPAIDKDASGAERMLSTSVSTPFWLTVNCLE